MDNLLARRANRLHLSTGSNGANGTAANGEANSRIATSKRFGDHPLSSKRATFHSPMSSGGRTSSDFGLGSGAFASFAKSNGPNPFESTEGFGNVGVKSPTQEREDVKPGTGKWTSSSKTGSASGSMASPVAMTPTSERPMTVHNAGEEGGGHLQVGVNPLRDTWCFWVRPPLPKSNNYVDYADTLWGMATVSTGEEFWSVYGQIKRPSALSRICSQLARPSKSQPVIDLHLFKKGIRPIWEDKENRHGGKWIARLPKGLSDKLWEDLLLGLIGNQFDDANEGICGAVLSVRELEDIMSIWTSVGEASADRIRDKMRELVGFPVDTRVEFKSHHDSIQHRVAYEGSRRDKVNNHHQGDKRQPGQHDKERDALELAENAAAAALKAVEEATETSRRT